MLNICLKCFMFAMNIWHLLVFKSCVKLEIYTLCPYMYIWTHIWTIIICGFIYCMSCNVGFVFDRWKNYNNASAVDSECSVVTHWAKMLDIYIGTWHQLSLARQARHLHARNCSANMAHALVSMHHRFRVWFKWHEFTVTLSYPFSKQTRCGR